VEIKRFNNKYVGTTLSTKPVVNELRPPAQEIEKIKPVIIKGALKSENGQERQIEEKITGDPKVTIVKHPVERSEGIPRISIISKPDHLKSQPEPRRIRDAAPPATSKSEELKSQPEPDAPDSALTLAEMLQKQADLREAMVSGSIYHGKRFHHSIQCSFTVGVRVADGHTNQAIREYFSQFGKIHRISSAMTDSRSMGLRQTLMLVYEEPPDRAIYSEKHFLGQGDVHVNARALTQHMAKTKKTPIKPANIKTNSAHLDPLQALYN